MRVDFSVRLPRKILTNQKEDPVSLQNRRHSLFNPSPETLTDQLETLQTFSPLGILGWVRKWASPHPLGLLICIICANFSSLPDLNETWYTGTTFGAGKSGANFKVIQGKIGGHFEFLDETFLSQICAFRNMAIVSNWPQQDFLSPPVKIEKRLWIK